MGCGVKKSCTTGSNTLVSATSLMVSSKSWRIRRPDSSGYLFFSSRSSCPKLPPTSTIETAFSSCFKPLIISSSTGNQSSQWVAWVPLIQMLKLRRRVEFSGCMIHAKPSIISVLKGTVHDICWISIFGFRKVRWQFVKCWCNKVITVTINMSFLYQKWQCLLVFYSSLCYRVWQGFWDRCCSKANLIHLINDSCGCEVSQKTSWRT